MNDNLSSKTIGYGNSSAPPFGRSVGDTSTANNSVSIPALASAYSTRADAGGNPLQAPAPDLIMSRLAATKEWLDREAQDTFSIQLMGTNDEQQLKNHLNVLSKYIEINKVFVYRTKAKQKPSTTVLYGSFDNARDAKEALASLPQFLKKDRPLLRTVRGVRMEIKQYQSP
jgi:septal ring-binding cell division protein DamX